MSDNMRTGITLAAVAGLALLGYALLAPRPQAPATQAAPADPGQAAPPAQTPPPFGIGYDPCKYMPDSPLCKKWI